MNLVPIADIPKEVQDTPTDNLMKIYKVCLQMEDICRAGNGVGLSAVQVGIPWKLFIVRSMLFEGAFQYFVNCKYDPLQDVNEKFRQSLEGCLSLPGRQFLVNRYSKIKVSGKILVIHKDLVLNDFSIDLTDPKDIYSIIYQHEIDHGNLITIDQIGTEIDLILHNST
jgi:peptide deformylase